MVSVHLLDAAGQLLRVRGAQARVQGLRSAVPHQRSWPGIQR
jgi:hypothetical protein